MQILSIYVILLLKECRGTLGSAVNEAYFALFSMGGHLRWTDTICVIPV